MSDPVFTTDLILQINEMVDMFEILMKTDITQLGDTSNIDKIKKMITILKEAIVIEQQGGISEFETYSKILTLMDTFPVDIPPLANIKTNRCPE
jgi:hypothetical protein